jgi:lipopolysaccharide transport system permease protein
MATGAAGGMEGMTQQTEQTEWPQPALPDVEPTGRVQPQPVAKPIRIEPPRGWQALNAHELWHHRDLVYFFIWRELKVRYKQTVFGGSWAVAQPLLTMVVLSVIFGSLLDVPSDGVPYPVFSFVALLPWTLFATGIARAGNSLVQDPNLLSKVYFPRVALPLAAISALLVDFAIAFVVLIGMMLFYGIVPGVAVLTLPLFLLLAYVTALAVGLWLSAANVKYRDIIYVIPVLVQFWLYLTPVAYPASLVPEAWQPLYGLNPMAGVVEGFRWALLGTGSAANAIFFASTGVAVLLLATGLLYFRRMERQFADVI